MMEDFENEKCLHKRYAYQDVLQTRKLLPALPSLVDITVPNGKGFTVCGDVYGRLYDLLNIFELNGLPLEENLYLFNGDFLDRGSFSLEVILTLFSFKCMCPSAMHLSSGNHESRSMKKIYGFEGEARSKLSKTFVELFAEVFCCLPLAQVLNRKVFIVYADLFSVDGVKLSNIRAIHRVCEPPEEGGSNDIDSGEEELTDDDSDADGEAKANLLKSDDLNARVVSKFDCLELAEEAFLLFLASAADYYVAF